MIRLVTGESCVPAQLHARDTQAKQTKQDCLWDGYNYIREQAKLVIAAAWRNAETHGELIIA